jgi:molybdate transport system substrate-binding protein
MRKKSLIAAMVCITGLSLAASMAAAAEIKVLCTIAPKEAYLDLFPAFEKASPHKISVTWAGTVDIVNRMAAGEIYDLVVVAGATLDDLIKKGSIVAGSRVDLVKSQIGAAVRAGAPKPDIGSVDGFKQTLLAAKSIGYSTGPSGVYLTGLFQRLGIADQLKPKLKQVATGLSVGELLARGDADIGFQQVSELIHFPGITFIGPIPAAIQQVTVFSGGIHAKAKEGTAAKELMQFLTAPAALPALKKAGLERG